MAENYPDLPKWPAFTAFANAYSGRFDVIEERLAKLERVYNFSKEPSKAKDPEDWQCARCRCTDESKRVTSKSGDGRFCTKCVEVFAESCKQLRSNHGGCHGVDCVDCPHYAREEGGCCYAQDEFPREHRAIGAREWLRNYGFESRDEEEAQFWQCPHCGGTDCWFDRSVTYLPNGEQEGPYMRCSSCGKDEYEPVEPAGSQYVTLAEYIATAPGRGETEKEARMVFKETVIQHSEQVEIFTTGKWVQWRQPVCNHIPEDEVRLVLINGEFPEIKPVECSFADGGSAKVVTLRTRGYYVRWGLRDAIVSWHTHKTVHAAIADWNQAMRGQE